VNVAADQLSRAATRSSPVEQLSGIDSVYFLMFAGWRDEMMSNRWHYAARWARNVPVVLLQPNQIAPRIENQAEPEVRIPGCEILSIRATGESTYGADALIQAGQVYDHMRQEGFRRPLLWCYNPHLAGLYAALPAVARVYHATENYFHFSGLSDFFFRELRVALSTSDVILAVSEGVAASIREETGREDVEVITNGCDRAFYRGDAVDRELASQRDRFDRVAVYAGNINGRVDFELVDAVAAAHPSTLLAFYGPVAVLTQEDARTWARVLRRRNVRHFGPVPSSRLPDLYRAADVGFIPYKRERALVENGFPLKALEMGATALPVVSSYMKPIVGVAEALVVAHTTDDFISAFGTLDRVRTRPEALVELAAVCDANDYDEKFISAVRLVTPAISAEKAVTTSLDVTLHQLGTGPWYDACVSYWKSVAVPERPPRRRSRFERVLRRPAAVTALLLPASIRRRLPSALRRLGRHLAED